MKRLWLAVAVVGLLLVHVCLSGTGVPGYPAIQAKAAPAQAGEASLTLVPEGYDLSWWTVDGGGGASTTGAGYSLHGTAGQADAGALAGGPYTLAGGFWPGSSPPPEAYYLPVALREFP